GPDRIPLAPAEGGLDARLPLVAADGERLCKGDRFSLRKPGGDRTAHRRTRLLPDAVLRQQVPARRERRPLRHDQEDVAVRSVVDRGDAAGLRRAGGVGREHLRPPLQPAGERAPDLHRRQAVDVEGAASGRAARDQRASRPGRPAGAAGDGLAGRDPQLLHPGAADQAGRRSGPLRDDVVPRRQGRPLPPVLRRILRHRPREDGRMGDRDEPARFRQLAAGAGRPGNPRRTGPAAVPALWLQRVSRARRNCARAQLERTVRKPGAIVGRKRRHCRRKLCPRFDPRPEEAGRGRLCAGHADLRRADQRRRSRQTRRLHPVDRPAAGGRRLMHAPRDETYLNSGIGIRSWLLTTDHKRIALLYFAGITFFFFVGGIAASLIRLELITPQGDLGSPDFYNRLFTMHGIIMVWFFLIPSIPTTMGNFILPMMIGARDLAFPRLNLLSWYLYIAGGLITVAALLLGGVD